MRLLTVVQIPVVKIIIVVSITMVSLLLWLCYYACRLLQLFGLHNTLQLFTSEASPFLFLTTLLQRIFQVNVLKGKFLLDTGAPSGFPVEINIGSLFVIVRCYLWLLVALKPGHVLFVESPRLLLELPSCQILLIGSLLIIENVKEGIGSELFKNRWILEDRVWNRWEGRWC